MIFKEIKADLFSMPDDYVLVHCISSDARMGAGIAVEFVKRFPKLKELRDYSNSVGGCVYVAGVLNLITKEKCYHKPTMESLIKSLHSMLTIVKRIGINKIAMPTIGCGLDRLDWKLVKIAIKDIFKDENIEIIVCHKP